MLGVAVQLVTVAAEGREQQRQEDCCVSLAPCSVKTLLSGVRQMEIKDT